MDLSWLREYLNEYWEYWDVTEEYIVRGVIRKIRNAHGGRGGVYDFITLHTKYFKNSKKKLLWSGGGGSKMTVLMLQSLRTTTKRGAISNYTAFSKKNENSFEIF